MNTFLNQLKNSLAPILGLVVFCALFIIGIFVFSYVLIFAALAGLVLFCIGFVRFKLFQREVRKQEQFMQKNPQKPTQGRVIDYEDIDK